MQNEDMSTVKLIDPREWLEFGQKFHGHKCPAMPLGLRAGAAALNKLGVERSKDGQIIAFVDIGEDHCATCFADGLQVIMGTTFGKGNIKRTNKGKWAVTVVDKSTGKAVRVSPKAEVMLKNKQSDFFKNYREKGIPASKVPVDVVDPLINNVINAPEANLLNISELFDFNLEPRTDSFNSFVCDECGEMTVERYGRIKNGKHVCIDCAAAK